MFEGDAFSVVAALGWSAMLAAVFALVEWVGETFTRSLSRFLGANGATGGPPAGEGSAKKSAAGR